MSWLFGPRKRSKPMIRTLLTAAVVVAWGMVDSCPLPAQTPVTLVSTGATWRYLDDGSNQQAAWREPDFSDSEWDFGPAELGFGENDEATRLQSGWRTYYFRHEF